jgi:hypothetical protein
MTALSEQVLSCDPGRLADALARVDRDDAAAVPILDAEGSDRLARAAESLGFRTARSLVGQPGREVTQDFEIADSVPQTGPFGQVARELESAVSDALARFDAAPFDGIVFNDLVVQRYPHSTCGISPHRDHVKYVKLIVNLAIAGAGRFYICPDRSGTNAREIESRAGDAILMRGPGWRGCNDRPFHCIGEVSEPRLILGLREDSRQAG